ncbi:hypothetical protein B5X24_HaOG209421 [Helicoverpa armigera]|uniref:Uncharacterized protein n=1 Tax=Helicoverpa armigera TaxID=29058 RepID=A0A2W1BPD7_HELAM|nr:hypothetical protein B5X24_HaOG209421 [Helicoverpa armigera]
MTGFVVFLTLAIVAHITAAPVTNYGDAYADDSSYGVVVVSGSSFGDGAFATNWRPSVQAQNQPVTEQPNLDSPTSCPPCPPGNKKPVSFSIHGNSGWVTVENSTFGDGAFANHHFDKPLHVLVGSAPEGLNVVSSATCPPCPQACNYGNANATNGSTGLVVIDNATFANGAFSNGGSGSGTGSSSGTSGSSSGGSSGSNSGNNQSKPATCGPIKTIISTIIPSLNCSTSG